MSTLNPVDSHYVNELNTLIAKSKTGKEAAAWLSELLEHSPLDALKASVRLLVGNDEKRGALVAQACYVIGDCVEYGYAVSDQDRRAGRAALEKAVARNLGSQGLVAVEQLGRLKRTTLMLRAIIPPVFVQTRRLVSKPQPATGTQKV